MAAAAPGFDPMPWIAALTELLAPMAQATTRAEFAAARAPVDAVFAEAPLDATVAAMLQALVDLAGRIAAAREDGDAAALEAACGQVAALMADVERYADAQGGDLALGVETAKAYHQGRLPRGPWGSG